MTDTIDPTKIHQSFLEDLRDNPNLTALADGVIQEANRQFFHPIGWMLGVRVENPDGISGLFLVHDDDPEGCGFADLDDEDRAKAAKVREVQQRMAAIRTKNLGYVIQPLEPPTRPGQIDGPLAESAEEYEASYGEMPPDSDIEPGILQTVLWLRAQGYRTVASCDGHGEDLPWVTCDVPDPAEMVETSIRLHYLMVRNGLPADPVTDDGKCQPYFRVEAHYFAPHGMAGVKLIGVDDDMMRRHGVLPQRMG